MTYEAREVRMWGGSTEWWIYKNGYQWIAKSDMTESEAKTIAAALNAAAQEAQP